MLPSDEPLKNFPGPYFKKDAFEGFPRLAKSEVLSDTILAKYTQPVMTK